MNYSPEEVRVALNDMVDEIVKLQFEAELPMPLRKWLSWLECRVEHKMKKIPVRSLDYPWESFMRQQDHSLLWAASWYARKREEIIVRKVRATRHFDNDRDYITHKVKFAVTQNTQTCGSGNQVVYVYGFKNDPEHLKVGFASNASNIDGAFQRVMQQVSTSNRTLPTLYRVILTDDCETLEKKMHRRLKDNGQWAYDGAGKEWFRASLEDVLKVYHEVAAAE